MPLTVTAVALVTACQPTALRAADGPAAPVTCDVQRATIVGVSTPGEPRLISVTRVSVTPEENTETILYTGAGLAAGSSPAWLAGILPDLAEYGVEVLDAADRPEAGFDTSQPPFDEPGDFLGYGYGSPVDVGVRHGCGDDATTTTVVGFSELTPGVVSCAIAPPVEAVVAREVWDRCASLPEQDR